jgi:hypothetical protein
MAEVGQSTQEPVLGVRRLAGHRLAKVIVVSSDRGPTASGQNDANLRPDFFFNTFRRSEASWIGVSKLTDSRWATVGTPMIVLLSARCCCRHNTDDTPFRGAQVEGVGVGGVKRIVGKAGSCSIMSVPRWVAICRIMPLTGYFWSQLVHGPATEIAKIVG